jgi:DNA-binding response OmpR family regulator
MVTEQFAPAEVSGLQTVESESDLLAVLEQARYHPRMPLASPMALIVEDDPDLRELLAMFLARHDMESVAVGDVSQALAALAIQPFSVVLLDVSLPDGSGLDVCEAVRANPDTRGLPVVMLTARDTLEDELRAIAVGANAYLIKPVTAATLFSRLSDLI